MKIRKFVGLLTAAAIIGASVVVGQARAAGSASFALSGKDGTYAVNSTLSIIVSESSNDPVNVATANLIYDASKLQFLGVDASSSGFGGEASTVSVAGGVGVSRFVPAGGTVTGYKVIAIVNFKALASSGSTYITFSNGASGSVLPTSRIASNGADVWNGATAGGAYNFATPAPASAPAPAPASTGGSGSSSPSSPATSGRSAIGSAASTTATANTGVTNGAVKAAETKATEDTAKPKTTSDKKTTVATTADKKNNKSVWPWVILAVVSAVVFMTTRKRRSPFNEAQSSVKATEPKSDKQAAVPVAAKVTTDETKAGSKKPANSSKHKKSAKKSNKRNR